jgi:UDP-glucose 4-epimerase
VKTLKPKIAVVGGTGFIGGSLARHLTKGFQVIILDVKPPQEDLKRLVTYRNCDIRNLRQTTKALNDVDLVVHTAIVQIPLINENKSLGYEVNIIGTQNVCRAVEENPNLTGMILAGSWHTVGERELKGIIDEEFGFRPDKVESRARLYALSKIAQESIVRFYDEMSDKIYGVIRMGTVLGNGMPEKTAANIFVRRGLKGEAITPYKHSMHRPMLYVDISDVCRAFEAYAKKIFSKKMKKSDNSLAHIVNVYYPQPITILELAEIVRKSIVECTSGEVRPKIEIVDRGVPLLFAEEDRKHIRVDVTKAEEFLELGKLESPRKSIQEIVKLRTRNTQCS